MDIFIPIAICFILFVFFSLCGMCCKRRRDQGAVIATPVVITSTQHHVGPYPVTQTNVLHQAGPPMVQQHGTGTGVYPMPQPMYNAMPGQQQQQQQHYPGQHAMPMPMPMPMPGGPGAPMVPPPVGAQPMMDPPSYDQVVTENYPRQAAYNPHFTGN